MASWGKVELKQLKDFQKKFENLYLNHDIDALYEACCRELAARLLALVIPKTPVGKYPKSSGKKGGTLRRGWVSKTQAEAESGQTPTAKIGKEYAKSLAVTKSGSDYIIEIINPVEYAIYVEYGHRIAGGSGYVEPRYMLTLSEETLRGLLPGILEKKLMEVLKREFENG